jgi:hypothetical protein
MMHLVAIVLLIWIIFGHTLCSCCRTNIFEGFATTDEAITEDKTDEDKKKETGSNDVIAAAIAAATAGATAQDADAGTTVNEGFSNYSNATFEHSFLTNTDSTFVIDPSKWSYSGGATPSASKPNYQSQSQDSSQMNIIENMKFAPECCPSMYSSSQGCACMSDDTINFLAGRGGNNVPFSEY